MQRKRLEYIDAMRGIAILFIVFGHIQTYCYGITSEHLSSFRALTSLLQLPMFFFVSGFAFNPQKMLTGGENIVFKVQTAGCPNIVLWRNIRFHK